MAAGMIRLPVIDVAAAIVQDSAGRILLAERKPNQLSPGFWELPGGKIESGETPVQAASRELTEEVGIRANRLVPWASYAHAFPTRRINLRFFRADSWDGTPYGREGQRVAWVDPAAPSVGPLLPSNERVLQALSLPRRLAIAGGQSSQNQDRILSDIRQAIGSRINLVILQPPPLSPDQRVAFARRAQAIAAAGHARVVLLGSAQEAQRAGAAGALSDAAALRQLASRPALRLWGAICEGADDLQRAIGLGADFVLLGPVLGGSVLGGAVLDRSVPDRLVPDGPPALGWDALSGLAGQAPFPVFAWGGMRHGSVADAVRSGAHGIAGPLHELLEPEGVGGHA